MPTQSAKDMTDILDIEGIVASSWSLYRNAGLALLVSVLLLALLYLLWRILQKRKTKKSLPPYQWALAVLKQLAKNQAQNSLQQNYFELDRVLRDFISQKLHINYRDKTYEEAKEHNNELKQIVGDELMTQFLAYQNRVQEIKFSVIASSTIASSNSSFEEDKAFVVQMIQTIQKQTQAKAKKGGRA